MIKFKIGQRWISESEPELGLGIIESVGPNRVLDGLGIQASGISYR